MSVSPNYFLRLPKGIQVFFWASKIMFKGRYGITSIRVSPFTVIESRDKLIIKGISRANFVYCQTFISLLQRAIRGAAVGYKMKLELRGLGFRCNVAKNILELKLGFSHIIRRKIPTFLAASCCIKGRKIVLKGASMHKLSEFAHLVQNFKFPESFKGKGIFFKNQKVLRKQGKKV